ncbi:MAG: hypothetical protein Q9174_001006 [Haloplaca sp. 1 TL-2023]
MPRLTFPLTPAPSTDIVGKEAESPILTREKTLFSLPPPAIAPLPAGNVQAEEQEDQTAQTIATYALPPPPTRNRKIIQMTPKMQQSVDEAPSVAESTPAKTRTAGGRTSSNGRKNTGKKQPSSTSQAGKRIARKTAHSVIERRRRSKMNEEFGVLKSLIPACKDQDMHKLAILQASIDYLRYLEDCITNLKAASGGQSTKTIQRSPPPLQQFTPLEHQPDDEDEEDEDTDVEMTGSDLLSLQTRKQEQASYTSSHSTTTSPALESHMYQTPTAHMPSHSHLPSPALGPQASAGFGHAQGYSQSASTSPTLIATSSKEDDEEATAALLMLNKDRRSTTTSSSSCSSVRGMSVKDLLSS